MAYALDTKPTLGAVTWASIVTTWASETGTWATPAGTTIYTNDSAPSSPSYSYGTKPSASYSNDVKPS